MDILDMRPSSFTVCVSIMPEYKDGNTASYSHSQKTITVYADKVTDGIFAHEVGHAVVCCYFITPPPPKMQEILTQYVDRHLWEDY